MREDHTESEDKPKKLEGLGGSGDHTETEDR